MNGATIRPIHHSVRAALAGGRRLRPNKMERAIISREMADDLMRIALEIFADCTNAGVPFQDAILAVYLSGLENGSELAKEMADDRP